MKSGDILSGGTQMEMKSFVVGTNIHGGVKRATEILDDKVGDFLCLKPVNVVSCTDTFFGDPALIRANEPCPGVMERRIHYEMKASLDPYPALPPFPPSPDPK
jgi:hypothetical protein